MGHRHWRGFALWRPARGQGPCGGVIRLAAHNGCPLSWSQPLGRLGSCCREPGSKVVLRFADGPRFGGAFLRLAGGRIQLAGSGFLLVPVLLVSFTRGSADEPRRHAGRVVWLAHTGAEAGRGAPAT